MNTTNKLRAIMAARNITVTELARKMGVVPSNLSNKFKFFRERFKKNSGCLKLRCRNYL